jgi:DNA-binding GntR family transcriptional regulator
MAETNDLDSILSLQFLSLQFASRMKKLTNIPNLTELTYRSVKEQLLDGTLVEGTRLIEEHLANQLGISKSPVREALNRLEAEGLICIESRRGAYVREFSIKEVIDLFELREILELHSIAAAEITQTLLSEMAESIERTKKFLAVGNKLKHVEEDLRFHGLIASATGNAEFCRVFENIQQKSLLCRYKTYHLSGSTAPNGHGKIYQRLKQQDRDGAKLAMREHIRFVKDRLLDSLEASSSLSLAQHGIGSAFLEEIS